MSVRRPKVKKGERRHFEIRYDRAAAIWALIERVGRMDYWLFFDKTKASVLAYARKKLPIWAKKGPSQLRIKTKLGRIAAKGEHTYPRSSDPRRTKG